MFDACFYISLDGSADRREAFLARVAAADWPFPVPERWPGVLAAAPPWWRTGAGAWGVFLAHFRLYHYCMEEGIRSAVVFEDDAVFADELGEQTRSFMAAVPDDWHQVYFGGAHHVQPTAVNAKVLRCRGTNGAWAYAVRGAGLSVIHELVGRFPVTLEDENAHIDVMWHTLHKAESLKAYAPWRWLVGHAAGVSDRCEHKWTQDEWFNLTDEERFNVEQTLC